MVKKRILLGLVASMAVVGLTTGAGYASGSTVQATQGSPAAFALTCPVGPGNYCSKIFYKPVSGGIRLTKTQSIGFTTGAGKAREWFEYSCTAGTCFFAPTKLLHYSSADTLLAVQRKFGGGGFFLGCGVVFGVNYINPAVNAPHGPSLYRVACTRSGNGSVG